MCSRPEEGGWVRSLLLTTLNEAGVSPASQTETDKGEKNREKEECRHSFQFMNYLFFPSTILLISSLLMTIPESTVN